jgi:hypothetical protein
MAINIAVRLLSPLESRDNVIHQFFQFWILRLLEPGRSGFQPLRQIGIPENAPAPIPIITDSATPMHLLIQSQRIYLTFALELAEFMKKRGAPY